MAPAVVAPMPMSMSDGVEEPGEEVNIEERREEMRQYARDCVLVIDGLPIAPSAKYDLLLRKVTGVLAKLPGKLKMKDKKVAVAIPQGENGSTLGYGFVQYATPDDAVRASRALHGMRFDRNHTFWALTEYDLNILKDTPQEFVPPTKADVKDLEQRVNFKSWLVDPRGRDQFMIRAGEETSIYWHDPVLKPELEYSRQLWTDSAAPHAMWSPKGTFLATFHEKGIQIWARIVPSTSEKEVKWDLIARFEHMNVRLIDFSPCENYLITLNDTNPAKDDRRNPRGIVIWDVVTGKKKRGFLGPTRRERQAEMPTAAWPIFKWSHDDKYFARQGEGVLQIYSTENFSLLDKKSMKIPHIASFSFSPKSNVIAYWTPEVNSIPARVTLVDVPSKKELRNTALFSVSRIDLFFHPSGDYLCSKVDRLTKSKKGRFTNFELFRLSRRDIPIEVLEFGERERTYAFAWEPCGDRFAVIHGPNDSPGKSDVSIYTMSPSKGPNNEKIDELKHICVLENKSVNQLHWSPRGRWLLLASVGSQQGTLEWYDTNTMDQIKKEVMEGKELKTQMVDTVKMIGSDEHFLCSEVYWDPSGRFVATCVTAWRNRTENGYIIWNLHGKELVRENIDDLFQFLWRPRPQHALTSGDEKRIKKLIKKRRPDYEAEDKDLRDTMATGNKKRKMALRENWAQYLEECKTVVEEETPRYLDVLSDIVLPEGEDSETIEEVVEELVDVKQSVDFSKKMLTSDDERD